MRTSPFKIASLIFLGWVPASFTQNTDTASSKQPVAMVGEQAIYDDDLVASVQAQLLPLRRQEYEVKKRVLDSLIEQKLLEAAAKKNGITTEKLLQQEIDANVQEPTGAELQAFYLGQKDRLNRPFDEIKDQLRQTLKQLKIQQARQDYTKALLPGGGVVILLAPPKVQVASDPARLLGNPKAPVTIVEFSDYQCPYCRQVEPTLKDVLAKYGERVSLSYRDFPLKIHGQAQLAAEASRCAGEQGKFWEYHDRLYNSSNLERPALIDYARTLKIDEKQFDSCLASGKYREQVERDMQDGMQAGVSGTPGFFVNGVPFTGAMPLDTFVRAIDEELARKR